MAGKKGGAPAGGVRVIRKVKKKSGGGHHGGSWKVAYADFVTAMMAFFLLMWLLGNTDKETQKGLADYFKRPLMVTSSEGAISSGDRLMAKSSGSEKPGPLSPGEEAALFEEMQSEMVNAVQADTVVKALMRQIRIEMTEDGMRIEILDDENRAMFERGSAVMMPHTERLLAVLATVLDSTNAPLQLTGHTDATPYPGAASGYSNWELSADRANAARRILMAKGLRPERVWGVEGLAAMRPLLTNDPTDPSNRRIELLVLNQAAIRKRLEGS